MLAHLQGITSSAGGTPCQLKKKVFGKKNACMFFFCIGASSCIGQETLFLQYAGFFFIPYLRWKLVISYRYFFQLAN